MEVYLYVYEDKMRCATALKWLGFPRLQVAHACISLSHVSGVETFRQNSRSAFGNTLSFRIILLTYRRPLQIEPKHMYSRILKSLVSLPVSHSRKTEVRIIRAR